MQRPILFSIIKRKVREFLNGYVQSPIVLENIDTYIVRPVWGINQGFLERWLWPNRLNKFFCRCRLHREIEIEIKCLQLI